jgi:Bacterial PH domain
MQSSFKSSLSFFTIIVFTLILIPGIFLLKDGSYAGAAIIGLLIVFFMYLYFTTHYTITIDNRLIIKCGFLINENIDISEISTIKKTNTILSAPAFSFDRLYISYGLYHSVVISPVMKDLFLQKLLEINPKITLAV